ncbi:hypothetical protein ARMGADRAFT_1011443 [Armillaria gallica]|uniref:Uncharacterized protein n=1 Tax=Armillaria gallica TaxID=47427 RepID=A0A2H3DK79_ARMGA|nr:hypothetical protein ARMGADRAFT_1011443 [Armillaria gallica]
MAVIIGVRTGECVKDDMSPGTGLHPSLKFMGLFLVHLCMQMGPEYGFLEPPPAEDLLHEAFQRPIPNQIIEMEKDIDLDTVNFRETSELRRAHLQKMAVPF